MYQRCIDIDDPILQTKPFYNYFHTKDYTTDLRKCDNCFESLSKDEGKEEILYCETCNSYIHRLCYQITDDIYDAVSIGEQEDELRFSFIKCESCRRREDKKILDQTAECFLCKRQIGCMRRLLFDSRVVVFAPKDKQYEYQYRDSNLPVLIPSVLEASKKEYKEVFAHPICVNSCSCIFMYYTLLLIWDERDYQNKKKMNKQKKCGLCQQNRGFFLTCENKKKINDSCKLYYHPICAAEKKMIYYQQGMRLIFEDQNLKDDQLASSSNAKDSSSYYYIFCNSHVAEMFREKLRSGFFDEDQFFKTYMSNYDQNDPERLKNIGLLELQDKEDWFAQMIEEYAKPNLKEICSTEDNEIGKHSSTPSPISKSIFSQDRVSEELNSQKSNESMKQSKAKSKQKNGERKQKNLNENKTKPESIKKWELTKEECNQMNIILQNETSLLIGENVNSHKSKKDEMVEEESNQGRNESIQFTENINKSKECNVAAIEEEQKSSLPNNSNQDQFSANLSSENQTLKKEELESEKKDLEPSKMINEGEGELKSKEEPQIDAEKNQKPVRNKTFSQDYEMEDIDFENQVVFNDQEGIIEDEDEEVFLEKESESEKNQFKRLTRKEKERRLAAEREKNSQPIKEKKKNFTESFSQDSWIYREEDELEEANMFQAMQSNARKIFCQDIELKVKRKLSYEEFREEEPKHNFNEGKKGKSWRFQFSNSQNSQQESQEQEEKKHEPYENGQVRRSSRNRKSVNLFPITNHPNYYYNSNIGNSNNNKNIISNNNNNNNNNNGSSSNNHRNTSNNSTHGTNNINNNSRYNFYLKQTENLIEESSNNNNNNYNSNHNLRNGKRENNMHQQYQEDYNERKRKKFMMNNSIKQKKSRLSSNSNLDSDDMYEYSSKKIKSERKRDHKKNRVNCEYIISSDDDNDRNACDDSNSSFYKQSQRRNKHQNDPQYILEQQTQMFIDMEESFWQLTDPEEENELKGITEIVKELQQEGKQNNSSILENNEDEEDECLDLPDLDEEIIVKDLMRVETQMQEEKNEFFKQEDLFNKYTSLTPQNFMEKKSEELQRLILRKQYLEETLQKRINQKVVQFQKQLISFDRLDQKCQYMPSFKKQLISNLSDFTLPQEEVSSILVREQTNSSLREENIMHLVFHSNLSSVNTTLKVIGKSDSRQYLHQEIPSTSLTKFYV